jgi:hypothetical protein
MADSAAEPTLADVQAEFPAWVCWRAVSGLYYARRAEIHPNSGYQAKGEDPRDLRDEIIRAESQAAG